MNKSGYIASGHLEYRSLLKLASFYGHVKAAVVCVDRLKACEGYIMDGTENARLILACCTESRYSQLYEDWAIIQRAVEEMIDAGHRPEESYIREYAVQADRTREADDLQ